MEIHFLDQNKKSKEKESDWFNYCYSKNIPMVKTVKRNTYGDVDWDYITMSPKDDDFFSTQERFIISELNEILKHYANNNTEECIGSFTGMVKNIPIEYVSVFAQDLCNTLSEASRRHKKKNHNNKSFYLVQ